MGCTTGETEECDGHVENGEGCPPPTSLFGHCQLVPEDSLDLFCRSHTPWTLDSLRTTSPRDLSQRSVL